MACVTESPLVPARSPSRAAGKTRREVWGCHAPAPQGPTAASENGLRGPLGGEDALLCLGGVFSGVPEENAQESLHGTFHQPALSFLGYPGCREAISRFDVVELRVPKGTESCSPHNHHRISHTQLDKGTGSLLSRSLLDMSYPIFSWSTGHRASVWGPRGSDALSLGGAACHSVTYFIRGIHVFPYFRSPLLL